MHYLARCSLSELNTLWEWGDLSISESNLRPPLIWYVESHESDQSTRKTSQVTYVTMVPRVGNETLRPLGVATGNASSVTRVWRYIWKNTTCWPATAHDVTTGVPQYKCRREDTSSASSSEACVRSMAQSPGDAVSRSPLGEPWLHT